MVIHIEFSRVRIFRRMKRAEERINCLESHIRKQSEELTHLRRCIDAMSGTVGRGAQANGTADGSLYASGRDSGGDGKVSVQQIMDEYLNFPDERREQGNGEDDT